MRSILLSGDYSLLKIDETQYGVLVEKGNKSTSYRINMLNGVVSDVLVETLTDGVLDNEWHINIQYGLTDEDIQLLAPLF
jgi:hypothetical protein